MHGNFVQRVIQILITLRNYEFLLVVETFQVLKFATRLFRN